MLRQNFFKSSSKQFSHTKTKGKGSPYRLYQDMGHGGYGKRKSAAAERKKPAGPKNLAMDEKSKAVKPKSVSSKNHIRSIERMLRKDLPREIKEAQEKKLEELKKQQDRLAVERQIFLWDRKIKFFGRRKIERRLRQLEKQQRASTGPAQEAEVTELSKLKKDLEYVKVQYYEVDLPSAEEPTQFASVNASINLLS